MKKSILFVDDDPNVLAGLQRSLRRLREEWDIALVGSGAEALEILAERPFDVVVTDMRMPDMNGVQLLDTVMQRHPGAIRIVLSGTADRELTLKAAGATHRYLAKPCDPGALQAAIAEASKLHQMLDSRDLRQLVGKLGPIPTLPAAYAEIQEEMQSPEVSIRKVGGIVSRDVGMTGKILQLVNSAFFGLPRKVSNVTEALSYLGVEVVSALVLSAHVFSVFDVSQQKRFGLQALSTHSLRTAELARQITRKESPAAGTDAAFTAGLLHDVGKLVLAANIPDEYAAVLEKARAEGVALWEAEKAHLGATHAEVGAYLAALWGLPESIIEPLRFHHSPAEHAAKIFSPVTAVHVANVLEQQSRPVDNQEGKSQIDSDYLAGLKLSDRLETWREMSRLPDNGGL